MRHIQDHIGRVSLFPEKPARGICLVPSITELIYDLGAGERLVGITKFCVHPSSLRKSKTVIGGTKTLHIDKIHKLAPDYIIANKEENNKEDIETLAQHYPVYVTKIASVKSGIAMINDIAELLQVQDAGLQLANTINRIIPSASTHRIPCLYVIWQSPFMVAGNDTFISDMLFTCGFSNVHTGQRYPEMTLEEMAQSEAKYIFLASEPFPFKEKHKEALSASLPNKEILLIDGEMVSWYGSRMYLGLPYLTALYDRLTS